MFSWKNKYAVDKPFQRNDFIEYSPNCLATFNNNNSNIFMSPQEKMLMFGCRNLILVLNLKFLKMITQDMLIMIRQVWSTLDLLLYLVKPN